MQLLDVFYSSPEKERIVIVWELVQGDDLLEVVNRLNPNMLPEPRARRYFAQLLSGVKHIHANGFCHRDIKPENCMIDAATDTLKVIDFGMTKHLESAKTLMIGTPDYMAPELLTHNLAEAMHGPSPEGEYDPRAVDVWSMGALLFICVTGVFPFEDPRRPNDMCATLENVRNARYRQLPSTVSRDLEGAPLMHWMLMHWMRGLPLLTGCAQTCCIACCSASLRRASRWRASGATRGCRVSTLRTRCRRPAAHRRSSRPRSRARWRSWRPGWAACACRRAAPPPPAWTTRRACSPAASPRAAARPSRRHTAATPRPAASRRGTRPSGRAGWR